MAGHVPPTSGGGGGDLTELQRRWLSMAVEAGPAEQHSAGAGPEMHYVPVKGGDGTSSSRRSDNRGNVPAAARTPPRRSVMSKAHTPLSAELMPPPPPPPPTQPQATQKQPQAANSSAANMVSPPPARAPPPSPPPPPISHNDSFANLSVVSSLSGDDGQSISALGLDVVDLGIGPLDVVDELSVADDDDGDIDDDCDRDHDRHGTNHTTNNNGRERAHAHSAAGVFRSPLSPSSLGVASAAVNLSAEISLSLSESSESSDATERTGSLRSPAACSRSSSGLPPPSNNNKKGPLGIGTALLNKSPFKQSSSRQQQQQQQSRHPSSSSSSRHSRRNLAFPSSSGRQVSSQSAPSSSSLRRQLSAHAPLRDRLAALREGSPHVGGGGGEPSYSSSSSMRKPSSLSHNSRARSTPANVNWGGGGPGGVGLPQSYSNLSDTNSVASSTNTGFSRQGSIGHLSVHSRNSRQSSVSGVMSASAALALGTPPRPSAKAGGGGGSVGGSSVGHNRHRSTASVTSHASYASVQSSALSVQSFQSNNSSNMMYGSLPPSALVLGDGRIAEGVRRRNSHEVDPLAFLDGGSAMMGATPSPELLAGRPRRSLHRRAQSAAAAGTAGSGLPQSPVPTPEAAFRKAISDVKERDGAQPVESLREAEVRKVTNVVKKEIKYKLGKMVPSLHKRASSLSGGDAIQLQRASGCLT